MLGSGGEGARMGGRLGQSEEAMAAFNAFLVAFHESQTGNEHTQLESWPFPSVLFKLFLSLLY